MARQIRVSDPDQERLGASWSEMLCVSNARVLGVASAFVSVRGVQLMVDAIRRSSIQHCRLVAGTDYAITHPEALRLAQGRSWQVNLASSGRGVFHPKLFVAGDKFLPDGSIHNVQAVYVGSGNLTLGGFQSNVECGFLSDERNENGASNAFQAIWKNSKALTAVQLQEYAEKFAAINRQRSIGDLEALGIADGEHISRITGSDLRNRPIPRRAAIETSVANAAWAGLESVTGGYRYQIEFPRAAGEVIRRIVRQQASPSGAVNVYCEDGDIRSMQYRFYQNSMFRLNVPWDVPNVDWTRQNKTGIALVERSLRPDAVLDLTIHRPGNAANEIIQRSLALGTWGRTPTRLYGWF